MQNCVPELTLITNIERNTFCLLKTNNFCMVKARNPIFAKNFSIGTSGVVHPAASLPFKALEYGAKLVEINPENTPLTPSVDIVLYGKAGQILPVLMINCKL
jgi:hypothetical protein